VYTGPVKGVQPHFEAQGFVLPPRMDLPSWLGEITTPTGEGVLLVEGAMCSWQR
jgi:hypothetical protein